MTYVSTCTCKSPKEKYTTVPNQMYLTLMSLTSIPQLFTDQFQVTGDIKQVFCIRMKLMENALFTNAQLQIYKHRNKVVKISLKKQRQNAQIQLLIDWSAPFKMIMTIHFISCAFVLLISVERTEIFSALLTFKCHIKK